MDSNLVKLILEQRKNKQLKTHKEIQNELKHIVYKIYKKYLYFKNNEDNFRETIEKLDDYQYSKVENLEEGNYIRYISLKYFYDIKLAVGGFISDLDYQKGIVKLTNNGVISAVKMNKAYFFKKINKEDKIKLMLLDAL